MKRLAANLEWLFSEGELSTADRVRAAADQGFEYVEIWGWREKDCEEIKEALDQSGVTLLSLIVDPQLNLTDRNTHDQYLQAVRDSVVVAEQLNSPNLVVVAGELLPDVPREEQRAAVVDVLSKAVELVPENITLLLEPLNDKVDHPGTFLTGTSEGLDIIGEVGSPRLKLLLDAYHGLMMGEDLPTEIAGRISDVGHVQIADIPGRNQPGSGNVDWAAQLDQLSSLGYDGVFGLEYMPTVETVQSIQPILGIVKDD